MEANNILNSLVDVIINTKTINGGYMAIHNQEAIQVLDELSSDALKGVDINTWMMGDGSFILSMGDSYWVNGDFL